MNESTDITIQNNKKILIIGDKVISHSLTIVLNMITSCQFMEIDPLGFPNLISDLSNNEEIFAIIITTNDGIDMAKHIRLYDNPCRLSLLPIIILSPYSLEYHLRNKRDNVFLLSPYCWLIMFSTCIVDLCLKLNELKCFKTNEEMKELIRPYIVWSEDDEVSSHHDNFNKYGPFRLMREHSQNLSEPFSKDYSNMADKLWFKKYHFLQLHRETNSYSNIKADESEFRKVINNKRVLYIDDEHRLGWSSALYTILFENSNKIDSKFFQKTDHFLETSDSKLACIDDYDTAYNLFISCQKQYENALNEYSQAEHLRNIAFQDFSRKKKEINGKNARLNSLKESLEKCYSNKKNYEAKISELRKSLINPIDSLTDAYTKDVQLTVMLDFIKELKTISDMYFKEEIELKKYDDEHARNNKILEDLQKEIIKENAIWETIQTKNNEAIKRYKIADTEVSLKNIFPYDMVICDLRLDKKKDRELLPHEISGVKLLKEIKKLDPSIPVLIFTASEKALNYREVIALGASGYWIKSVNSLDDLKSEITRILLQAKKIRDIWQNIKKIESRKEMSCFSENSSTRTLEKGIMTISKKEEIVFLLKESFLLFIKESTPYEKYICEYTNYARIAINMGLILEVIYPNISGDKWDKWAREKRIDQDEVKIRQIRNKAAHHAGKSITYDDAYDVFLKTIDNCLRI